MTVDFGDGRVVAYGAADLLDLDHAYGLTVHRAQGSEWPGVVVLASSSFGPMLSRNLLYTALTRARRRSSSWATRRPSPRRWPGRATRSG